MESEALKLLIVDDEYLIRNLLRNCIRWENYGICIAGEAADANEALDLVDEIRPDLIFTDICMPSMDGIDFSRLVLEKYPEIKIVILTGHDDFEYAKRSIKAGISDFILKPIDNKEIKKVATELKRKIEDEKERRNTLRQLEQRFFNVSASYGQAVNALNYKVAAGKNKTYDEIVFHGPPGKNQIFNAEVFAFNLRAGIPEKAVELIDSFYDGIKAGINPEIDPIRITASNIISVILNVASEFDIKIDDIFNTSGSPFEKVFKINDLPEIISLLKEITIAVIHTIRARHKKKDDRIIVQIQEYLRENISSYGLSLASVAEKFHINASYLSRLFKKEMGVNFTEQLTKIRIEKAIRLLQETDMKVYKIGEAVGIYDPHYFSICFKKFTGMSINDYKKISEKTIK